jgi:hypothetical protein
MSTNVLTIEAALDRTAAAVTSWINSKSYMLLQTVSRKLTNWVYLDPDNEQLDP